MAALRAEGHSLRAIAALLCTSLGAVQRALKRRDRLADEYDDDEGGLFDPEPVLAEPFTFCGTEIEIVQYRHEDPRAQESERWMDANGRSCSVLDIYRYCMHTTDGIGRPDISADMARQRAAWG